jgi:hypothetical protein
LGLRHAKARVRSAFGGDVSVAGWEGKEVGEKSVSGVFRYNGVERVLMGKRWFEIEVSLLHHTNS